jgi:hypothetical protein
MKCLEPDKYERTCHVIKLKTILQCSAGCGIVIARKWLSELMGTRGVENRE